MGVQIRIRGVVLTEAIRLYVERKLQTSLRRFTGRLGCVQVTLTDLNGPRGGIDKSCRVAAELLPSRRVIVREAQEENLYAAIARATERIKHEFQTDLVRVRRLGPGRSSIRNGTAAKEHEIPAAEKAGLLSKTWRSGESR